jgi:endoglucanase
MRLIHLAGFAVVVTCLALAASRQTAKSLVAPSARCDGVPLRGINLAGGEFNPEHLPGVYGKDYIYPQASSADYYRHRGFALIRMPFLWERVQPGLQQGLNRAELDRLQQSISTVASKGLRVILSPHNFGRYPIAGAPAPIGSSEVSIEAFADFWARMTRAFVGNTAIYAFGLMNEPHDMNGTWQAAAQAALDAIRGVDRRRRVLAPGDQWSGAWSWQMLNSNFLLNDMAHNVVYDAHQYFDADHSGTYALSYDESRADPDIGIRMVQPFVAWLHRHRVRGIITEFGAPNDDSRWLTVVDRFLRKLDCERIPAVYWAGGPWWGDYPLSAEPRDGHDAPIMSVLTERLGSTGRPR